METTASSSSNNGYNNNNNNKEKQLQSSTSLTVPSSAPSTIVVQSNNGGTITVNNNHSVIISGSCTSQQHQHQQQIKKKAKKESKGAGNHPAARLLSTNNKKSDQEGSAVFLLSSREQAPPPKNKEKGAPPQQHSSKHKKSKKIGKSEESVSATGKKLKKVVKEGGGTTKKKKGRKPTAQEDIVDGFAFLAFKNYDELTRAISLGEEPNLCVQLLKGSHHKKEEKAKERGCNNAATNTSPEPHTQHSAGQQSLKPKNSLKRNLKKLMDQENSDGGGGGGERGGPVTLNIPSSPFTSISVSPCIPSEESLPKPPSKKSRLSKQSPLINHFFETEEEEEEETELLDLDTPPKKTKIEDNSEDVVSLRRKDSGTSGLDSTPSSSSSSSSSLPTTYGKGSLLSLSPGPVSSSPPPPPPPPRGGLSQGPLITEEEYPGRVGLFPITLNGQGKGGTEGAPKCTALFTPYARNTITRVSLGSEECSRVESAHTPPPPPPPPPTSDQQMKSSGSQYYAPSLHQQQSKGSEVVAQILPKGRPPKGGGTVKTGPSFGSIARLLDSPNTSSGGSSARSSPSVLSTNERSPGLVTTAAAPANRTHSPRGHSPSRERDSFSSNVSSLSRTSVTPVSSASSSAHLPPNLSPQLAAWLSAVQVPRPTPPPHPYGGVGSTAPPSIFGPGGMMPPGGSSQPPPSHYPAVSSCSSASESPLFHGGGSSAGSELVRRDLESRLMGDRSLLPHSLLPPHGSTPLYAPPIFKEMPKVGLESPFYRSGLGGGMSSAYPGGFNGLLPPPPNMGTPFAPPPSQMGSFTPKKSGRWNAMHIRIAWEIYQHQQKSAGGGGAELGTSPLSLLRPGPGGGGGPPPPELFRPPGFSRGPPELSNFCGGPPLLSPHGQVPGGRGGGAFDGAQSHPMYLPSNSAHHHLGGGGGMGRYPGFGGLGSPFGGLSGVGPGALHPRDLSSSLAPHSAASVQDQWARMSRGGGGGGQWPPQTEVKEVRRERGASPFRERSPLRKENGEGDGRSSRSTENSHKSVAGGGERRPLISDIPKGPPLTHPNSRMYCATMGGGNWAEGFPRYSSAESFRLSLLQLGERERELSRLPPCTATLSSMRGAPPFYGLGHAPPHPSQHGQHLGGTPNGGGKPEDSKEERR